MTDRPILANQPLQLLAAAAAIAASTIVGADDRAPYAAIAEIGRGAMVTVSYHLRFDDGEAPYGGGWSYTCPSCGEIHFTQNLDSIVEEERTADQSGILIAPTVVVTADPLIPPRFIEAIEVSAHGSTVSASIDAVALRENAVRLTLEQPLGPASKPLSLAQTDERPRFAVTRAKGNGTWTATVRSLSEDLMIRETGSTVRAAPVGAVLFDAAGAPVGAAFNGEIPAEGWVGDPDAWSWVTTGDLQTQLAAVEAAADRSILHAELRFRSPTKDPMDEYAMYGMDEDQSLERHVPAFVLGQDLLLLVVDLDKDQTARLEQIRVRTADGATRDAEFAGSLEDYGAILARAELPEDHLPRLDEGDVRDTAHALLPAIEIEIHGEQEERRSIRNRITGFTHGFQDRVFPHLGGPEANVVVFSPEGELIAFPIGRRLGPAEEDSWYDEDPVLTPVAHLAAIVERPAEHVDPSNVPLSEEEENRIAWLGTETQSLDADLARAMEIADRTDDGATGLMITYIYEGSPAARSGLQVGDIMLRIHTDEAPRPINLEDEGHFDMFSDGFPWEHLDELPEEYYDSIPTPWPSAGGFLNQKLTDIGVGNELELEYLRDGETGRAEMIVEYSPPYYRTAPKFENEAIGVTVRDMTYELQRYFQRTADDPGVVISKLVPGSRGSVSGLRPYEVITHIDDEPVMNVADFERLIAGREEIRLTVRRLNAERVVGIEIDQPDPE